MAGVRLLFGFAAKFFHGVQMLSRESRIIEMLRMPLRQPVREDFPPVVVTGMLSSGVGVGVFLRPCESHSADGTGERDQQDLAAHPMAM